MGTDSKILAQDLYQQIYSATKLNPRTVQWYATEGLLPKPQRIGTEAFYDESAQIWPRLQVILLLQKRHGLKLKDIKHIIERQKDVDWESVLSFLQALEDTFPRTKVNMVGYEIVNEPGWKMSNTAVNWLREGRHPQEGWLLMLETVADQDDDDEVPF